MFPLLPFTKDKAEFDQIYSLHLFDNYGKERSGTDPKGITYMKSAQVGCVTGPR